MSAEPVVTIGIPIFNAARTLSAAVRSVFSQTYVDWELILVDDGSVDGSDRIASSIRDPRVRVVRDTTRRGLPFRLNQIASLARGRYLARMDADDVMHPERLAKQVAWFRANADAHVLGTHTYIIDQDDSIAGKRIPDVAQSFAAALNNGVFIHPTVMMERSWALENPYDINADRAEDIALWASTWHHSKFAVLPEPLFFYRETLPLRLSGVLRGQRTHRGVLKRHGVTRLGRLRVGRMIGKSLARSFVYAVIGRTPFAAQLYRQRNTPVGETERAAAQAMLHRALSADVPGLTPVDRRPQ